MANVSKQDINTKIPLLIGFVAGFTFLLAMFVGLGIALESIFVIGIFVITIIVAVGLLLLGSKK